MADWSTALATQRLWLSFGNGHTTFMVVFWQWPHTENVVSYERTGIGLKKSLLNDHII
jgi:hypothetical protein